MNIKVLFVLLVSFCVFSPVFAVQARKPKVPFDRSGPAVNKEGMDSLLLHKTKDGENVSILALCYL